MFESLKRIWNEATFNQKAIAAGLGVAVLVGGIFLASGQFPGSATNDPLFTNLQPSDAAAIVQKLQADKAPYSLSSDGSTIFVAPDQVAALRLEMASAGLPKNGVVGLEIFDQSQFGMTNFQQQVVFVQAQQGELARTLDELSAVAEARVSIVTPQPSVFTVTSQPTTAAVFLRLKPYSALTPDQVNGIVNLVSHSVQGLSPKNVSVIDSNGNLLSAMPNDGGTGSVTGDLAIQANYSNYLQSKVQSMLNQLYGPGNTVVQVQANLDMRSQSIKQLAYQSPQGSVAGQGLIVSQQNSNETSSGTGGLSAPTGTSSNVPPTYQSTSGSGGTSNYSKTSTTQNFDINQTQTSLSVPPGAVLGLSVAVAVNRTLTLAQTNTVAQLVYDAVGFQAGRDQVTVTGIPFTNPLTSIVQKALKAKSPSAAAAGFPYVYVGIGAAVLLVLFLLLRRGGQPQNLTVATGPGISRVEVQQVMVAPPPPSTAEEQTKAAVEDLIREKPDTAAQILRTWMKEE